MNSTGIIEWIAANIVPIILVVIGVIILAGSKKGNMSGTMLTSTQALIGLVFIFGAAGIAAFGDEIASVVFNGTGGGGGGNGGGGGGGGN